MKFSFKKDRILIWDSSDVGRVERSHDDRAFAAKVRGSLILGGTLCVRMSEIVELNRSYQSAITGDLRALRETGRVLLIGGKGGSLESHVHWGYLDPPKHKQYVSYRGRNWKRDIFPSRLKREIESRTKALLAAGWDRVTLEVPQSAYNDRSKSYKMALKRINFGFPCNEMALYAEKENHVANRGEIYALAETSWISGLKSNADKKVFMNTLRSEIEDETILAMANAIDSHVSWLRPKSWVTSSYFRGIDHRVLLGKSVSTAIDCFARIFEKSGHPDFRICLDPQKLKTQDFVEFERKHINASDRRDLSSLLFGPSELSKPTSAKLPFIYSLVDSKNGKIVNRRIAKKLIRARLEEYQGNIQKAARTNAVVLAALSGIGFVIAIPGIEFVSPEVTFGLSAGNLAGSYIELWRGKRRVLGCFHKNKGGKGIMS